MAYRKFGKLHLDFTPDGLYFQWGKDGQEKLLNLGPLNRLAGDEFDREDDGEYEDVYDGDSRYSSSRYDDGYDYDERPGRNYRSSDDYDDGYEDDNYEDDRYDDRYEQPDDDEPYYQRGYDAEETDDPEDDRPSPLLFFSDLLEDYPWIVYILLVLLPPLGIYLLWRKQMFDFTTRTVISVISGLWALAILIWLIFGMGGNTPDDPTINATPGINLASPEASIQPAETTDPLDQLATVIPEATGLPGIVTEPSIEPTATALASADNMIGTGDDASDAASSFVYSPTTGAYYHKTATCSSIGTAAVTRVSLDVATSRNQSQCPTCYGSTTYYMNSGGKYYHSSATCDGMSSAEPVSKSVATKAGKTACPKCIREFYISSTSPYYHSRSGCSGITNASQTTINSATAAGKTPCPTCIGKTSGSTGSSNAPGNASSGTTDYAKPSNKHDAGVIVYAKKGGSYYHRSATCTGSGMTGGQKITLYNATSLGFTACKHCLPDGNDTVYCDQNGSKYHSTKDCTAAKSVVKTSRGKALAVGADKCSKCWTSSSASNGTSSAVTASGPKVYITSSDNHYHTRKACNGIKDPSKISLREAMAMGKTACNDCAGQANQTVYAASGDSKYHFSSSCSKLTGKAVKGTLAMALADELSACSACVKNNNGTTTGSNESEVEDGIVDKSGISVYITKSGSKYHSSTSCSELGAEEYYKVSLGVADTAEKSPCSKCCATASHKVYSSSTDKYYHFNKNCSLLPGTAKSATLARALMDGLKACSACTTNDDKNGVSATPAPEVVPVGSSTSGKKVYVTQSGKNYHITNSCSKLNAFDVKGVSLETAKNYGLTACSTCSDIAKRTVYGNDSSKYYHSVKNCNGVANNNSGSLEKALLAGLKACPVCVNGSGSSNSGNTADKPNATVKPTATPKPSTGSNGGSASGTTKVYIDITNNSNVYHKTSKCSKLDDAVGVTLNYVLDIGMKGCSTCNPPTKAD